MDLIRRFTAAEYANGLSCWAWIGLDGLTPMYATVFGDMFLMSADGGVWFLDTVEGRLDRLWDDLATLQVALDDPEVADRYLYTSLATVCEWRGIDAAPGRILSFRHPPVLGGAFEAHNVVESDFVVCLGIAGQIHEQVRHLPPGTPISLTIEELP